jgi:hypothetical protein
MLSASQGILSGETKLIRKPEGQRGQGSIGREKERGTLESMDWGSHGVAL